MRTGRNQFTLTQIPRFTDNAVIYIIIGSAVGYVCLSLIWAVIRIVYPSDVYFFNYFVPLVGLAPSSTFLTHFWTLLTYGWFLYPNSFWALVTNMIWVYTFGSVVQSLIGYKQIIPLYIYCLATGGAFYLAAQLLPGMAVGSLFMGPSAGVIGFAVASVTLSPKYRFYFTDYFSLPLYVIVGIYLLLSVLSTGLEPQALLLIAGGGLMGFLYIRLLQSGYRPGDWMLNLVRSVESLTTPELRKSKGPVNPKRNTVLRHEMNNPSFLATQKRVDEILDKINQRGYNSLTEVEKEILKKAGQD